MENVVKRRFTRGKKIMNFRWKQFFLTLISVFFPILALADDTGTMSFAPPASDISVTFLGNIFGVVDGVLHGTGSQIMGKMFAVFNAAVLALGGIVIMYIILVSTMNTAHEGQMLGQKWSGIWVPVRATIGLALLIPKASGYCLMQIFVMWVVLQGVGIADKIWGAALDYLNVGGVIIKANMMPEISMGADGGEIMLGASKVLYGQVCMAGVQKQLENVRDEYLDAKDNDSGPCSGSPSGDMKSFCETSVPDFLNTVDPITAYDEQHTIGHTSQESFLVDMPNFDDNSLYYPLNGMCGQIGWMGEDPNSAEMQAVDGMATISTTDMETIEKSRAAAIEQVYITLSTTAKRMVSNDPQLNANGASDDDASKVADDQFGIPLTSDYKVCTSLSDDCPNWGADDSSTAPVLLDGTELQDAVADYNAIMAPVLKLQADAQSGSSADGARQFITEAKERGWIMAGSYFFDLALLNGSAASSTQTDKGSKFGKNSKFEIKDMTSMFQGDECAGTRALLCVFVKKDVTPIGQVVSLLNGDKVLDGVINPVSDYESTTLKNKKGTGASTVYGYGYNGALIDLAVQEGTTGPTIVIEDALDVSGWDLEFPAFDKVKTIPSKNIMFGWGKGFVSDGIDLFINYYVKPKVDFWIELIKEMIQKMFDVLVVYPLVGFTWIFNQGVNILGTDGVNPILAVATMGVTYINFAMNLWLIAAGIAVAGMFDPGVFALYMMVGPLFLAWVTIMLGIGFVTAYFVPFLPYMIFTFGTIAWMISVIEAMVAAPIVALGVSHPEGHDALGKSEQGLMILLNVFLRPGMMVIGYIAGIALSFVGVWIMNAGFQNLLTFLESDKMWAKVSLYSPIPWARFFGFFFSCLIYTMMYLTIIQKAFTLIAVLPDKVLRWIGGQPEGVGQETMQWSEETKSKVTEGGKSTGDAGGAMAKQAKGALSEKASSSTLESGDGASSTGGSTPPPA